MTITIRQAIGMLLEDYAEHGVIVSPARIEADIRDLHADVFGEYAVRLAARGVRDLARDMLTKSARSKQMVFDGMELPSWFTRPDAEGEFSYVPLRIATLADHAADVEVKRANVTAAQRELKIAEDRDAELRSVDGATDDMTVLEAARLLAGNP